MIRIAPLHADRAFTIGEIDEILPALHRITAQAEERVHALTSRYGVLSERDPEQGVLEHQVMDVIRAWGLKIMKLGGQPMGVWEVGFQGLDGAPVYQWKYPAGSEKPRPSSPAPRGRRMQRPR